MRLGIMAGYSGAQASFNIENIQRAEKLGFDSVWTAEAWGSDAVTPLAWIGANTSKIKLGTAIMQLPARSPAMTAMTAMTLDQLSGGRFLLGLGTSGPQVVEGWHGVPFNRPLTWMREYITICRTIFAREEKLSFQGKRYRLPYDGEDGAGLGKPLKSILHGRKDLPIYTGSMAPKGQQLSGEIADGCLLVFMDPRKPEAVIDNFQAGFDKAGGGKSLKDFDVAPSVTCIVGDSVEGCQVPVRMMLALYIGGMGARDKNFYNEYAQRLGYEAEAKKVQDLYLEGKKQEAMAALPQDLVDAVSLTGPKDRIREQFQVWKDLSKQGKVGTMLIGAQQPEAMELLAELAAE